MVSLFVSLKKMLVSVRLGSVRLGSVRVGKALGGGKLLGLG